MSVKRTNAGRSMATIKHGCYVLNSNIKDMFTFSRSLSARTAETEIAELAIIINQPNKFLNKIYFMNRIKPDS